MKALVLVVALSVAGVALVLTLQVLNGHGRAAWRQWINGQPLDWLSAGVSLAVPAILILLVMDWRARRRS